MCKPLLFYMINERTDYEKYFRSKGMKPVRVEKLLLDGKPFERVSELSYKGYNYTLLESSECYSEYMGCLMRLPEPEYKDLLEVSLFSRIGPERMGAIGRILKKYPKEFEQTLADAILNEIADKKERSCFKRMVKYVYAFLDYSQYISKLENVRSLCESYLVKNTSQLR